jgi:cellulose synthase/poly-beta-1,6-N-acetylglucosamine synthase-like glycosyltransferase
MKVEIVLLLAFWGSLLLVVYAYLGYPCWAWLLARVKPKPIHTGASFPAVEIVMPVHRGASLLAEKLRNLSVQDYPAERLSITVVIDGDDDGSAAIANQASDARVRVLHFAHRRGKAACLNDAVAATAAEVVVFVDVRQRLAPDAVRRLVANLADPDVGAVSGELVFERTDTSFGRGIDAYWRYEKALRLNESKSGSTIGVTGALYALRRDLYRPIPETTILDDVLIPMRAALAGARVVFEPAALAHDRVAEDAQSERRRKVRTLAGNFQLLQIEPRLLDPRRNPLWFRFVSHKLARLAAPWAICVGALAAFCLAPSSPFFLAASMAFALLLALVILAPLWPRLAATRPMRLLLAFWHLNRFSAEALLVFVRNRHSHLW